MAVNHHAMANGGLAQQQQGNQNVYAVGNAIPQPPTGPVPPFQLQNGGGGANVVDGGGPALQQGPGVIPTPPPQMPGMITGAGAPPPPPPPSFGGKWNKSMIVRLSMMINSRFCSSVQATRTAFHNHRNRHQHRL